MKFRKVILSIVKLFSKITITSIVLVIRLYRIFISPFFPDSCRYYPTCSKYAIQSIKAHGLIKGGYLSIIRLIKCNPFSSGGIDLVKS